MDETNKDVVFSDKERDILNKVMNEMNLSFQRIYGGKYEVYRIRLIRKQGKKFAWKKEEPQSETCLQLELMFPFYRDLKTEFLRACRKHSMKGFVEKNPGYSRKSANLFFFVTEASIYLENDESPLKRGEMGFKPPQIDFSEGIKAGTWTEKRRESKVEKPIASLHHSAYSRNLMELSILNRFGSSYHLGAVSLLCQTLFREGRLKQFTFNTPSLNVLAGDGIHPVYYSFTRGLVESDSSTSMKKFSILNLSPRIDLKNFAFFIPLMRLETLRINTGNVSAKDGKIRHGLNDAQGWRRFNLFYTSEMWRLKPEK